MRIGFKYLGFLIVALFAFTQGAKAQRSATATMKVTVKVVRGLQVAKTNDLNFGDVKANSGQAQVASTSNKAGGFVIQGEPGSDVNITLPKAIELKNKKGHKLQMDSDTPVYSDNKNGTDYQKFKNTSGGNLRLSDKSGRLFIRIGGKLNSNGAQLGTYSGTYTTTVEYM